MFRQLFVPVDGSPASFSSLPVAARMARAVDGRVDVVTVVDRTADVGRAEVALERGIDRSAPLDIRPHRCVLTDESVTDALARLVESTPGAAVAMCSHGHGRSPAVAGSVTGELLRKTFGPVIVVGPRCPPDAGALDGTYVVALDGSPRADCVLPIVAAWTVEFGGTPWLVEVVNESLLRAVDFVESAYVSRRAGELRQRITRDVEHEVLHGEHPARSIVDFASNEQASLIFLSTHGRTGLGRLWTGSVAAEIVRRALCPVVLFRPPELTVSDPRSDVTAVVAEPPPEWSRAWCEQVAAGRR